MESKDLSPKPNDNYILTPDEERAISEKAEELYAKRIAPYAPDLASPTREAIINFQMPKELQATLLQDIKDYADIEASIRIGRKLAEYEIRFFYFKKSCDVRMQRHIIRYLNTQPALSSEPEIIRDILEEIEDDVDDIAEDELTPFGGNRFLEILNSKNIEKFDEYTTFINSLPNAPQDLVQRILDKMSKFKL